MKFNSLQKRLFEKNCSTSTLSSFSGIPSAFLFIYFLKTTDYSLFCIYIYICNIHILLAIAQKFCLEFTYFYWHSRSVINEDNCECHSAYCTISVWRLIYFHYFTLAEVCALKQTVQCPNKASARPQDIQNCMFPDKNKLRNKQSTKRLSDV